MGSLIAGLVESMNKQERIAWLGAAVFSTMSAYLAWHLFAGNGEALELVRGRVGHGFLLFVAGYWWISRRMRGPLVDERDRQIALHALQAGYAGLALALFVTATLVGLDDYHAFARSRSPAWQEIFLVLCIASSLALACWVRLFHYWRDRR